jgi:hypothetical protein
MVEGDQKKRAAKANKFFFPKQITRMMGGLEAWKGFYTSVRPVYKSLMVNVNVATTAFYTPMNLYDAMIQARTVVSPRRFTSYYFGLRVSTKHLQYKTRKTIRRVMEKGADEVTFSWAVDEKTVRRVTVAQYFKSRQSRFI